MNGVGDALNNIAAVCSTFENSGPESTITTARPLDSDIVEAEAISMEIGIEIPLLDDSRVSQGTDITLKGAELTADGTIRLTCLAKAFPQDVPSAPGSEPTREPDASPETEPRVKTELGVEASDEAVVGEVADDEQVDDRRAVALETPTEDDDRAAERQDFDGPERPPYQDPDRLREVYEKHSTFGEMTDALEVDVTPQTVRRYMIKHDIHEPSPTTGSSSISTLLEADPDTFPIKSEDRDNSEDDSLATARAADGTSTSADGSSTSVDGNPPSTDGGPTPVEGEGNSTDGTRQHDRGDEGPETTPAVSNDGGTTVSSADGPVPEMASSDEAAVPGNPVIDDADIEPLGDFTMDEIRDVVYEANTLTDVQRELGVERTEARDVLQELNLLSLVHGRLSTRDLQKKTIDEINDRIQSAIRENR